MSNAQDDFDAVVENILISYRPQALPSENQVVVSGFSCSRDVGSPLEFLSFHQEVERLLSEKVIDKSA